MDGDFTDYSLLKETLDRLTSKARSKVIILSGHARGADQLGERWAFERRHTLEIYRPDWSQGQSAGPRRNELMAASATHCVVFWNGVSKGSKSMVETARKHKLKLRVVRY